MEKIKCVIIDDEPSGRIVLHELLKEHCREVQIIAEAADMEEGYKKITELNPDFVFLDIRMPGGSGFDLLKKFEKVNFEVVFVTSHNDYAITAFKYSAVDYLLKPVEVVDLKRAIEKVKAVRVLKSPISSLVENFLENIDEHNPNKKMAIHDGDKVIFQDLAKILYFEAEGNYTKIHVEDNKTYQIPKSLGELEEMLPQEQKFWRVNRGAIINLNQVKNYSKGENCVITLNGGAIMEVSRRKKIEMNERFKNLLIGK